MAFNRSSQRQNVAIILSSMSFLLWGVKWVFPLNLEEEAHGFNKWQLGLRIGMRGGRHRLEPTLGVGRCRHKRDGAHTGLARGPEVWAVPIEAVCHNILEREYPRLVEVLDHGRSQLRFA